MPASDFERTVGATKLDLQPGATLSLMGGQQLRVMEPYEECLVQAEPDGPGGPDAWCHFTALAGLGSVGEVLEPARFACRRSTVLAVLEITDVIWEDAKKDVKEALHGKSMMGAGLQLPG